MTVDVSGQLFDIIPFFRIDRNGDIAFAFVFQSDGQIGFTRFHAPVFVFTVSRLIGFTSHQSVIAAHIFDVKHYRFTVIRTNLE
ncbi:Uncharacterised protein [Vibrio cholerae]|uniref:Uncharacterized protein n=1 Tax=Vibrio cholerae TaxID=666 RepID=A0A655VPT1_VIBCL|nr:Uncharacterised protein [Vibrio cholerae]CSB35726.1 Uncharacterised protein [Vibrio cholerae]CSB39203.1 Uncharacterised protein [Vibrio cholerae]CSB42430.1 Uncharacterised protein [Vibrio cholerae]CSB66496.1 Uncharacterised protein [Vibrio cholerae]